MDNKYSEIKIHNSEITVNGSRINGVRSIKLFLSAESIPTADVEIELGSTADFEGLADAQLRFAPDTLSDAVKSLQFAMKIDNEFRRAVIASAKSALNEWGIHDNSYDIAEAVVRRIFGEDEY